MSCSVFFFKQKTAYEMRISDWSSDVCSSDLRNVRRRPGREHVARLLHRGGRRGDRPSRRHRRLRRHRAATASAPGGIAMNSRDVVQGFVESMTQLMAVMKHAVQLVRAREFAKLEDLQRRNLLLAKTYHEPPPRLPRNPVDPDLRSVGHLGHTRNPTH